jgi:hypothetical protein
LQVTAEKVAASKSQLDGSTGWKAGAPQSAPRRRVGALLAFVIFCTVNAFLWRFVPIEKLPTESAASSESMRDDLWSGTGAVDVVEQQYSSLQQRPTIVLLGSSLVMNTFWLMDHLIDPSLPDLFHYHGSFMMEARLSALGLPKQRVFNLATAGQMVSDSYIWVNELLVGEKKPNVIVLGVAPRDFYDADLPAILATSTFKRLVGLKNFDRYASVFLPRWQDKADFLAAHSCYFYGKRWRLQREAERAFEKSFQFLGLVGKQSSVLPQDKEKLRHDGFLLQALEGQRWQSSLREYRGRYQNIDKQDLSVQMGLLGRLADLCHQRGIKLILVDMPLSMENRALLPNGFYQRFRQSVGKVVSDKPGVEYVDLGASGIFGRSDFFDSAHLNQAGGHKLLEQLTPAIVSASKSFESNR